MQKNSITTLVAARIAPRTSVDWFLGIHDVDMVRYVTGLEVTAVRAAASSRVSANRDLVRGSLTLTDGTLADFSWSWILPPQRCSGLQAGLEVIGSDVWRISTIAYGSSSCCSTIARRIA